VYWNGTLLYIIVSGEHQFFGRLTYASLGSTVMVVEIRSFRDFATGDTVLSWLFHGRRSFVGIGNHDYRRYWRRSPA